MLTLSYFGLTSHNGNRFMKVAVDHVLSLDKRADNFFMQYMDFSRKKTVSESKSGYPKIERGSDMCQVVRLYTIAVGIVTCSICTLNLFHVLVMQCIQCCGKRKVWV